MILSRILTTTASKQSNITGGLISTFYYQNIFLMTDSEIYSGTDLFDVVSLNKFMEPSVLSKLECQRL